jgi:hypothetical protein
MIESYFVNQKYYMASASNLILSRTKSLVEVPPHKGMEAFYKNRIEELELALIEKKQNLRRLEA